MVKLTDAEVKALDAARKGKQISREALAEQLILQGTKVATWKATVAAPLPRGSKGLSAEEIDDLVHDVRRKMKRERR